MPNEARGLRVDLDLIMKIIKALSQVFSEQQTRGSVTPRSQKRYEKLMGMYEVRAAKRGGREVPVEDETPKRSARRKGGRAKAVRKNGR